MPTQANTLQPLYKTNANLVKRRQTLFERSTNANSFVVSLCSNVMLTCSNESANESVNEKRIFFHVPEKKSVLGDKCFCIGQRR